MMQYQYQLVVEFINYKLSTSLFPRENISKKYLVHLEGYYRNKIIKSTEYQLKIGTQLTIPWSDRLDQIIIHYYYLDERLKMELGYSEYHLPNEKGFSFDEPNRISLSILPNGGMNRIGKVICLVSVEKLYANEKEEADRDRKYPLVKNMTFHIDAVVPGFRFRRLSKAVNWNKIRTIDLDRVIEMNDVSTILGCIDDVAVGDAAEEDCDPRVLRALHIAQFTTQYLLSSKKLMDEKKKIIKKALNVFEEEEEVLDLKLTKYKARKKAMMREMEEMDRVMDSYRRTLIALKPKLHHYKLDEILKDSDDEGENIDIEDYERWKRNRKNTELKATPRVERRRSESEDSYSQERKGAAAQPQATRQRSKPSPRATKENYPNVEFETGVKGKAFLEEEDTDNTEEQDLIIPRGKVQQRKLEDTTAQPMKGWKIAQVTSSSQDQYDKTNNSLGNTTRSLPVDKSPKNIGNAEAPLKIEQEADPNAKVKTFTSFQPIVVNRKALLEEQYNIANDISEEDESLAAWKAPRAISKPAVRTVRVETKPAPNTTIREISPPSIQLSPNSNFDPAITSDLKLKEETSTIPSRISKNQTELLEFARKKKEMTSTLEIERSSTVRSSSGFDSTNVLSVDSLNFPVYNQQQVVDETDVADQTFNTTSRSTTNTTETSGLPQSSLPTDIKVAKTWTPASDSPSMVADDPVISKFDARLNNTFPATSAAVATSRSTQVQSSNEGGTNVFPPDTSSLLMESYDSNIHNLIQETSVDVPNMADTSLLNDTKNKLIGNAVRLSIEVNKSGNATPATINSPSSKLSEASSPVDLLADEKAYPLPNNQTGGRSSSSYASKKTSSYKQTSRSSLKRSPNQATIDREDPFSPAMNPNSSFISNLDDVDVSQSITIDFDQDNSTQNRQKQVADSKSGKAAPPKSPYSRPYNTDDFNLGESSTYSSTQEGYNSSLTQKSSPSPNTLMQSNYGGNRRQYGSESGDNEDIVLLGTGKYPSGKINSFNLTDTSPSKYSADSFERDSVDGNNNNTSRLQTTPVKQKISEMNTPYSNNSSGFINQSTELSPVFDGLKDSMSQYGELSYSSMHQPAIHRDNSGNSDVEENNNLSNQLVKWEVGRAPIEKLELAEAIEFHISAIRFNSNVSRAIKEFYVCVEFLDVTSNPSPTVTIRSDSIAQALSYYAYMITNEETTALLTEEIAELRENLCCTVYLYNKAENTLLGQATLELWAMIEHSCNILRQEANIYTPNMSSAIGSVVFDVKGHRLLTACAT